MDLEFLHHLKDTNELSKEQFEKIIQETRLTGESFLSVINKFGIIQEEEIIPVYAEYISFPFVLLKGLTIDDNVLSLIPAKYAFYYKVIPFKEKNGFLHVALTDPNNVSKLDELRLLVGYKLKPHLCGEKDITDSLKEYYGVGAETVQSISENEEISRLDVPEKKGITIDEGEEASIIKFVNQILYEAYKDRATDIHIEPFEDELKVRYRIDGVLFDVSVPQYIKKLQESIISRIKVIAGMNIAEKRLPQDGRIELKIKDATLDLRVSTLPTPYGETISIRLLTERGKLFDLDLLGFSERDMTLLGKIISKPHGIVLLTGPTGSGKTTTLYSFLRKLNKGEIKILTIEDPIEYQLKGISQMQVQPQIGFSFVNALRFMLRHDPDIMMVGEIRDVETAETAIRVALTGHLVFSTLHTIDAISAVTRLVEMGIEPYLVSSSVECIIAQRLVRVICSDCKEEIAPPQQILKIFGEKKKVSVFRGKGCPKCKMTGYKGRTAIYEIFSFNDAIRDLVLEKASIASLRDKAVQDGMATLKKNGWQKIKDGITTIEEVLKVTQDERV